MTVQPINKALDEAQHFFNSQAFADGLKATFAILLPSLLGKFTGYFEAGIAISVGAMCVSLTDAPGPYISKRNGMLICCAFILIVVALTSLARLHLFTMALIVAVVSFFFSMFNLYGSRAAGVGNAAILAMIITMDKPLQTDEIVPNAVLMVSGGLFYTSLSLLTYKLWPYRIAQRMLGDSVREVARYLSIKADFYFPATQLVDDYSRMVTEHVKVHEKQDAVREVMFKTRTFVNESTAVSRKLLVTFVQTVDLFDDITATYYDYALLRKQFEHTGILEQIGTTMKRMAVELDAIGKAIEGNHHFRRGFDYDEEIRSLNEKVNALATSGITTQVLKRILVNIRTILNRYNQIQLYFQDTEYKITHIDHSRFVTHQPLHPKIFFENLYFDSSIFRHSLRVAIASVAGFAVAKIWAQGHHSYWILLTIAFILKPAFSLTQQRNIERIIGTVAGGMIAVIIFFLVENETVQFALMVLFMLGTYSFMRIHYLAMVVCVTPYVLLVFKFFGLHIVDLAEERVIDTVIGSAIAFAASHFLFPTWEAGHLIHYMKEMVKANGNYLVRVTQLFTGAENIRMTDYRLARKNVYVASANLSAAFQRMLSEPQRKQIDQKAMQEFVVINHVLFSNIASIAKQVEGRNITYTDQLLRNTRRTYEKLKRALQVFDANENLDELNITVTDAEEHSIVTGLVQQTEYIEKLSSDIEKVTRRLLQEPE